MSVKIGNQAFAEQVSAPTEWGTSHVPAANTVATIAKAAPGAGKQLVVKSLTAVLAAGAVAPTAVNVTVSLVQDAGGSAVTLWAATMSLAAVAGQMNSIQLSDLNIEVIENKTVTLAFSAGGGGNTFESVAMTGYTKNIAADTGAS